jgi:hypothetical protein
MLGDEVEIGAGRSQRAVGKCFYDFLQQIDHLANLLCQLRGQTADVGEGSALDVRPQIGLTF